jgi:vitamin B12 transporter
MKKFLVSLLFTLSAFAQTTVSDTIVVTASALPEKAESTPAAVTVITKAELDQHAARDLADVLREVPGITIMRAGSSGKATSLFLRGAASTETLVLWNGIPINNPNFSGYDWGRFSSAGVEQIEVVRGPFSALYGSEAMAGVVKVLTVPQKSGVHADVAAGGHGLRNALLDGSWSGGTLQLSGSYEHRQDDGFAANDDFRQNSANAFAKWSPSSAVSIGAMARHTSYELGIPFNTNAPGTELVPSLARRQNGTETQLALPLTVTLGRFVNELTIFDSRRADLFADPEDPYGFISSRTDSSLRRARLTTRFASPLGTIIAGGESERVNVTDVTNFGPNFENGRRTDRSLFVEDRWSHELAPESRLELSAGVRHDDLDRYGTATSPRVAVAWINGQTKLRAAFGRAFRAPSVGELFFPFSGNPELRPEHARTIEFGGDFGPLSLTWFDSRYRDLIVYDPPSFLNRNIGRVRSSGLEAGIEHRIGNAVSARLSYTYLHRDDDETTGTRLARRPKHSGALFVSHRSGAVETTFALVHSGARNDVLPVFPFTLTTNRSYTTIDLGAQYHTGRFTPYVKLENATNQKYEEVLGFPSPRRRAIVGLRLSSF